MNALLNYGSSSSASEEDSGEDEKIKLEDKTDDKPRLPKPAIGENTLHTSVFSNPFVAAEIAKAAILEKHVKMVSGKDNTQMINGKKVCWNYRKGKCRFGHNCKYAHDSDIQKSTEELEAEKQKLKTVVCEGAGTMSAALPPKVILETSLPTDDETWEGKSCKKKKRPGLSQGLIPGQKIIKLYKEQKIKDATNSKLYRLIRSLVFSRSCVGNSSQDNCSPFIHHKFGHVSPYSRTPTRIVGWSSKMLPKRR